MKFELITKYADCAELLPTRATGASAGYDFYVATDIVIPSFQSQTYKMLDDLSIDDNFPAILDDIAAMTKFTKAKPTLVPTGIKCQLDNDKFLQLSVRSSCPLKYWLILANGVGIIDADYYNNPDNEGHIFFQIINLAPYDILLQKGDKIGQGIILPYYTVENDTACGDRLGGFGSTN